MNNRINSYNQKKIFSFTKRFQRSDLIIYKKKYNFSLRKYGPQGRTSSGLSQCMHISIVKRGERETGSFHH